MASSAPTAACPAWRDPARWHTTTDVVAVLIALSLPWSTSLVGIFGVVLLIAIAPTVELRAFWTLLKRPICVAPIALFCGSVLRRHRIVAAARPLFSIYARSGATTRRRTLRPRRN